MKQKFCNVKQWLCYHLNSHVYYIETERMTCALNIEFIQYTYNYDTRLLQKKQSACRVRSLRANSPAALTAAHFGDKVLMVM